MAIYGLDRSASITDQLVLKAWLHDANNVYLSGNTITFKVDGTAVASGTTNASGNARVSVS